MKLTEGLKILGILIIFPFFPLLVAHNWPWYIAFPFAFGCFCLAAITAEYLPS